MKTAIIKLNDYSQDNFATHTIQSNFFLHSHERFFEVSYVLNGETTHNIVKNNSLLSERITTDTILIIRPQDIHSFNDLNTKTYHRDIIFSQELFREKCNEIDANLFNTIINYPEMIRLSLSKLSKSTIESFCSKYKALKRLNKTDVKTQTLYIDFIFDIIAEIIISSDFISNNYILNNTASQIISLLESPMIIKNGLNELLKQLNYSHGHLCRICKTYFNKSPLELLNEYKLKYAAKLLKNTNIPISDISDLIGFYNPSYFIKLFKKKYNITPHQYRSHI